MSGIHMPVDSAKIVANGPLWTKRQGEGQFQYTHEISIIKTRLLEPCLQGTGGGAASDSDQFLSEISPFNQHPRFTSLRSEIVSKLPQKWVSRIDALVLSLPSGPMRSPDPWKSHRGSGFLAKRLWKVLHTSKIPKIHKLIPQKTMFRMIYRSDARVSRGARYLFELP